ncbi:hypothetical protein [Streptomyces djakartensis]|uniref:Gram-positive cocci surface proteins LPxTG domain-containing protein n=1 Tax=Streptomyces djakartensis TaxID=68193 RepID=A0ABQ2Z9P7_9ACTN|nr:hypothetical protein [Streptomyces djakartensis]GGY09551.1 hypothetical protein GCM10010384_12750 [Streptomyces djakartensis]
MPLVPLVRRAGTRTAVLAALTLTGTTLSAVPAAAAPGDNGDVMIHARDTPAASRSNDSRVCDFYLAAFDFQAGETVNWTVQTLSEVPAESGSVTLDGTGAGRSRLIDLPDGQYKLTWLTDRANGAGKFKLFQVDCPDPGPTPTAITPSGPAPAGGGGIARAEALTPVTGAAAVGLAAVAGAVWFRLRRRSDGAA